jgi:hypothetical protein
VLAYLLTLVETPRNSSEAPQEKTSRSDGPHLLLKHVAEIEIIGRSKPLETVINPIISFHDANVDNGTDVV